MVRNPQQTDNQCSHLSSSSESRVARGAKRRRSQLSLLLIAAAAIGAVAIYVISTQLGQGEVLQDTAVAPPQTSSEATLPASVTPSIPATEPPVIVGPAEITVNAVGDIAFVSSVDRLMASRGAAAQVDDVADYLGSADLTIANLETALSDRGAPEPGKTFTFRSDPDRSAEALRHAGIDVVSLANNHTRDWGDDGLIDTFDVLDNNDIVWAGAGRNAEEAFRPAIVQLNGAKVAYLAYSQIGPADFVATDRRSGAAYSVDLRLMKRAVSRAAQSADYVVVSFHWGTEKDYSPTDRQVLFGRAAIDAGADAVLAHHPHVVQGVEFYGSGMIAYSLGNFVFSPGSSAGRDSMVLSFTLGPEGTSQATARAVYLQPDGATTFARDSAARRITSLIAETSTGRGTDALIEPNGHTVTLTSRQ